MESPIRTTLDELPAFCRTVLAHWRTSAPTDGPTIVALHGDLGAGKTTFVQALARELGVEGAVTSPTFVVMKSYETNDEVFATLVHIDAYRIQSDDEMRPLQFADMLTAPRTLICIEWAEKIATLLPAAVHHLTFTHQSDTTRVITYGNKK